MSSRDPNRRAVFSMVLSLWLATGFVMPARAQGQQPVDAPNTCYTENVVAPRGTPFPVGVFVNNSDTLVGMQVPIRYRSGQVDLVCDSVSFVGSRCRGFSVRFFKIDPEEKMVFFAMLNTGMTPDTPASLSPGEGKVATIWFRAPEMTGSGTVILESGPDIHFPHEKINYGYLFWDPSAAQVKCRYNAGNITLK